MLVFPIGDDNVPSSYTPRVSRALLVLNVVIFLYQVIIPWQALNQLIMQFGAVPQVLTSWHQLYSLITSAFLHGGRMHLIGNMLFLRVFADNIEYHIGWKKFLLFYLLGAIAANVAHIIFNLGSRAPAIGASWAISALLWAYRIRFPHAQIRVRSLQYRRAFSAPAQQFLIWWIARQVLFGVGAIGWGGWGIARRAHIGWFAFGVLRAKRQKIY